ncbi:MAG: hypothetical protein QW051_00210 [Candidatus Aenigmatarchaeota archaeon]
MDIDEREKTVDIWRAEISMGIYDYQRYHNILKLADELALKVLDKDRTAIRSYYSTLFLFYLNIRPLFFTRLDEKLKMLIDEIENEFIKWEEKEKTSLKIKFFPDVLARKLLYFHGILLILKQQVGLGIKVEREESFKQKLKKLSLL